jgi:hypothetical protein
VVNVSIRQWRYAELATNRDRGQRVRHHVFAGDSELHLGRLTRRSGGKSGPSVGAEAHAGCSHVRRCRDPERDHAAGTSVPISRHHRIVREEDSHAVGTNRLHRFGGRLHDGVPRSEDLDVRESDVGDDDDVRARDGAELGHIPFVASAHLRNDGLRVGRRREEGHGQTDLVIERTRTGVCSERAGKSRGGEVLRGGLAVRTGDPHHGGVHLGAFIGGQPHQRLPRRPDEDGGAHNISSVGHDHAACAGGRRFRNEPRTISPLARQRDEQCAACDRPGIDGDGIHLDVISHQAPIHGSRDIAHPPGLHAVCPISSASSARATARSSNATVVSPIS